MKAWRTRLILVGVIVALPFEALLLIALWPYLPILGKAATGLFVVCCVCLGVRFIAFTWLDIGIKLAHRRREELHSRVIDASGVVVLAADDGTYSHLSAEHEASKAPRMLQPPPPKEDHRSTPETVLEMHSHGVGFKSIAQSTGWTEYQVRKLCNTHDGIPM